MGDNTTKRMWNPCKDVSHRNQIDEYVKHRKNYKKTKNLTSLQDGDDLIIAGHGCATNPSIMVGNDSKGVRHDLSYIALAGLMAHKMANKNIRLNIKLYMCYSADRIADGTGQKSCFAGQFFSSLKNQGFKNVKVAGYHGSLYWAQGHPHKVVQTKANPPAPLLKGEAPIGAGILIMEKPGFAAARHHREWFTNKPLGTRWM